MMEDEVRALLRRVRVSPHTIRTLLREGISPDEIIERHGRNLCRFDGVELTTPELAERLGLQTNQVQAKLCAGWIPDEEPKYVYLGRVSTLYEIVRATGLGNPRTTLHMVTAIRKRMAAGWTLEESIDPDSVVGEEHRGSLDLRYRGKRITEPKLSKLSGLTEFRVHQLLKRGHTPDQIVGGGFSEQDKGQLYTFFGEALTILEVSELTRVSVSTLRKRLRSGYTLEDAAFPPKNQGVLELRGVSMVKTPVVGPSRGRGYAGGSFLHPLW